MAGHPFPGVPGVVCLPTRGIIPLMRPARDFPQTRRAAFLLENFTRPNPRPQRAGIQAGVQCEKIKEIAATIPGMTVPAGSARPARLMDPERGMSVPTI